MRIVTLWEQLHVQRCNNFGTAITDGAFPASGSYIDVSDFERFGFIVRAGTLDSALTCAVKQASAVDGALTAITSATCTVGTDDDNEVYLIEVETRKMDLTGKRYVTLDVSGAAGGNDYLDIVFIGVNKGELPITQPSGTNTPVIVNG